MPRSHLARYLQHVWGIVDPLEREQLIELFQQSEDLFWQALWRSL